MSIQQLIICKKCKKQFRGKKTRKFCNRLCSGAGLYIISNETRKKMRLAKLGVVPTNKGKKYLKGRGKLHPQWQGGKTPLMQRRRGHTEYHQWKIEVLKIGKHICACCGAIKDLICHHIKSFQKYPKLRYKVKNGIILCRKCHPTIHRYGMKALKELKALVNNRSCATCGKSFSFTFNKVKTAKYCSNICVYNRKRIIYAV